MKTLKLLGALGAFLTFSGINAAHGAGGPFPGLTREMIEANLERPENKAIGRHATIFQFQKSLVFLRALPAAELGEEAAPLLALSDADIEARLTPVALDAIIQEHKDALVTKILNQFNPANNIAQQALVTDLSEMINACIVKFNADKVANVALEISLQEAMDIITPSLRAFVVFQNSPEKVIAERDFSRAMTKTILGFILPDVVFSPHLIMLFTKQVFFSAADTLENSLQNFVNPHAANPALNDYLKPFILRIAAENRNQIEELMTPFIA